MEQPADVPASGAMPCYRACHLPPALPHPREEQPQISIGSSHRGDPLPVVMVSWIACAMLFFMAVITSPLWLAILIFDPMSVDFMNEGYNGNTENQ